MNVRKSPSAKRILSLVLALILTISTFVCVPVAASASSTAVGDVHINFIAPLTVDMSEGDSFQVKVILKNESEKDIYFVYPELIPLDDAPFSVVEDTFNAGNLKAGATREYAWTVTIKEAPSEKTTFYYQVNVNSLSGFEASEQHYVTVTPPKAVNASVDIDYPEALFADDDDTFVVTATITNTGTKELWATIATLTPDNDAELAAYESLKMVGNLAVGASTEISWQVTAKRPEEEDAFDFSVNICSMSGYDETFECSIVVEAEVAEEPDEPESILTLEVSAPDALILTEDKTGYCSAKVTATVTNNSDEAVPFFGMMLTVLDSSRLVSSGDSMPIHLGAGRSMTYTWTLSGTPAFDDAIASYTITVGSVFEPEMQVSETFEVFLEGNERHRVTFDLNGAAGTPPDMQFVVDGGYAEMPKDPVRTGYVFAGWYASEEAYFNPVIGIQTPVTGDITLTARWEAVPVGSFMLGRDNVRFENGTVGSETNPTQKLNGEYYNLMFTDKASNWERLRKVMEEDATSGSCLGITTVVQLMVAGKLDPEFFQPGATCAYELDLPKDNCTIFNLITYYQLMQCRSDRGNYVSPTFDREDMLTNMKKLIAAMNSSEYPVLFGLHGDGWAHAVLACDYTETSKECQVVVWDCNDPDELTVLHFDKKTGSAYFEDGSYSGETIYVVDSHPVEEGYNDYQNLQEALKKLGYTNGVDALSAKEVIPDSSSGSNGNNKPNDNNKPSQKVEVAASVACKTSVAKLSEKSGNTFTLTATVTNTGNTAITDLGTKFSGLYAAKLTGKLIKAGVSTLAPGASTTFTWEITAERPAVDSIYYFQVSVSSSDDMECVPFAGQIAVSKAVLSAEVDTKGLPGGLPGVSGGSTVKMSVTVTNTGNATLKGVKVTCGAQRGDFSYAECAPVDIAPGGSYTFTWSVKVKNVSVGTIAYYNIGITSQNGYTLPAALEYMMRINPAK